MSTKAYYPRTEIGPGKIGFSKTRSIIEAPFYGNNVVKVNTLREAYELAKNSPGTVVTDMPVYRGEEFGLEPDAKVLLFNDGSITGRYAPARRITGKEGVNTTALDKILMDAVYDTRWKTMYHAEVYIGLDPEFMVKAHLLIPEGEENLLYNWMLNFQYMSDQYTKMYKASKPIGDGKEHSIGIQVDHPLLKENQGTDEDYVYFEYYWFDEVSLGDGKNTLNGPRSTEEQKRFSAATSNVEIQYVDGKHNTIPIAKTEHARYEGSSYEGYNDYYLVVVFGYHVVNGKKADTPFYLSANNGIGAGNANATHGPHLLQVKVDEVRVITATADEHGKIAPAAGTITVPKGESKTFTITPDSGYHIKDVLVDGKSVGAVSTYTFENVVDNHTIHATFARKHTPTPSTPTVEIPDDDALGLNTTDHFAYIVGYGNGEVRPQNNITRAEVATIFFRLLTDDVRDENLTKTNRYSDVAATSWYNTAVSTLSSMGIITGYPDGTFRPNAAITRAEFAAIAARFDNDGDKTAAKFSDIATHWAKNEISIAYNNGWITGYPDGTFGPQRDITRAETMALVNRVLNRQPETEDDLLPNMTVWTDNANPKAWYYLAVQEATNSHYYKFKTNSKYEKWTELRETRDWTQLEK